MRRHIPLITSLVLTISGLAMSPAHAVEDGPVNCGSSGTFTITTNVVTSSDSCAGAVVIPAGVTSIGDSVFANATSLTSITIPAGVTSIGYRSFFNTHLTSVTFESGSKLTSIGEHAFLGSRFLTSLTIPASVTIFGDSAFEDNDSLTSVTFESGSKLTSIGDSVFANATSLTSITIPAGVTSLGYAAFYYTPALTSVTFESGSKLTSIGEDAFSGAESLTSITIPAGVTSIGGGAFRADNSLSSVYFRGDAPTAVVDQYGGGSFAYIPTGAKAYIKSGATGFDLDTDGDGNSGVWYGLIVTVGFYTVTYNTTGGSEVNAQDYGVNFPTPTSPTRTGYTFTGWSATAGGSVINWPNTPALGSDITLYAKWTRNSAKAAAKVKPTVSGTAKVSKTLTAKKGTWSGYPNPALTYQWYSCTKKVTVAKASVPSTCKKITGATKSKLKLVKAQKGKFISVLVTGKGTGTSATKWLSKSTSKVK